MIERPASVRLAAQEDESALLDLLISLHRNNEAGWGHPYDLTTVRSRIEAGTRPIWGMRTLNQDKPQELWDKRTGIIGVIGPRGGPLVGSVGLFNEPFFWFSQAPSMVEIWFYVRPDARNQRQHHRDLFAFSQWAHESVKAGLKDYRLPMLMMTGFVHAPRAGYQNQNRFEALRRLWRRMSGAQEIGALFARR